MGHFVSQNGREFIIAFTNIQHSCEYEDVAALQQKLGLKNPQEILTKLLLNTFK